MKAAKACAAASSGVIAAMGADAGSCGMGCGRALTAAAKRTDLMSFCILYVVSLSRDVFEEENDCGTGARSAGVITKND